MGICGPGNFDSDAALDFVYVIVEKVREELHPPTQFEDIAMMMGAVEVYMALVEHCHGSPPDRIELESLRDKTLAIFDKERHAFTTDDNADHIAERRVVIADTFNRFLQLCEDE